MRRSARETVNAAYPLVRGAPDQDIGDIDNVEIVFANGVAYDPALLLSRVKGLVGWR